MEKRYLVLPVSNQGTPRHCFLHRKGQMLYDFTAIIDTENPLYHTYIDVTRFGIPDYCLTDSENRSISFTISDVFPSIDTTKNGNFMRPAAHYSATLGWTNDPNGLVYKDGIYHMFYQHNPTNTVPYYSNMMWGHAVSADLVHWDDMGDSLFPDDMGAMFSGGAIVDEHNAAGFGKDAILLFYTAAGGITTLSENKPFTQCLAYSLDNGFTFVKYKNNPIIAHIYHENRDPKVQWCEEIGKYLMALFMDVHTYMVFTSDNLLDWEKWFDNLKT